MAAKPVATLAMPKTLGAAIDLLYTLRAARLEAEKVIEAKKDQETALTAHILQRLKDGDLEGGKGDMATASIMRSTQADITDFTEFCKYVAKHKAWDLLRQQPAIIALRARWDNKENVPGVTPVVIEKLSLTKASSK